MRTTLSSGWSLLAALLLFPPAASAQSQSAAAAPAGVAYPKWDVSGTVGLLITSDREFGGEPYSVRGGTTAWNLDLGRYLTTHLKVDVGAMFTAPRHFYRTDFFTIAGSVQRVYSFTESTAQPVGLSGAATYQFFENAFVHPYVSGGIRVVQQTEHRSRIQYPDPISRATVTPRPVEDDVTSIVARPFAAIGCKSYFNERTFMRSELLIAPGPHGFSHATLRIGAGIDF